VRDNHRTVRISAKADYALRAVAELAAAGGERPVKADLIARAQKIPLKFLLNILSELKHARILHSHRGADGGYQLARPADSITLAEVIRAVEGPLANVRGIRPESVEYDGPAEWLQQVWIAVRASLRSVLETVTLADVAAGKLPEPIVVVTDDPEAWQPH
jgi:Rrf2 family protein